MSSSSRSTSDSTSVYRLNLNLNGVIDNPEYENNSTEATGHDVEKAEVECIGLSFPAGHGLHNDNEHGFFTVVAIQATTDRGRSCEPETDKTLIRSHSASSMQGTPSRLMTPKPRPCSSVSAMRYPQRRREYGWGDYPVQRRSELAPC